MKTRIKDLPDGRYSFQYTDLPYKRPLEHQWRHVGGHAEPLAWATPAQRDRARTRFTRRRTVEAALADLRAGHLIP